VLYEESFHTVYSVTQLPVEEALHMVEAKSILSVVSVQPHDYRVGEEDSHFFIWEQLGLDIGILGTPEIDNT
jgi:hypothetical protein